jgi:hypothetical protein
MKEGVEIQKRLGVATLDQRGQIDLVEALLRVGAVAVVEPPEVAIGQDAPGRAAVLDVEGDLIGRVLVAERVAGALEVDVERAIPVLGIADR